MRQGRGQNLPTTKGARNRSFQILTQPACYSLIVQGSRTHWAWTCEPVGGCCFGLLGFYGFCQVETEIWCNGEEKGVSDIWVGLEYASLLKCYGKSQKDEVIWPDEGNQAVLLSRLQTAYIAWTTTCHSSRSWSPRSGCWHHSGEEGSPTPTATHISLSPCMTGKEGGYLFPFLL